MNRYASRIRAAMREFMRSMGEIAPEQAALLITVGLVLGVFPIMGVPTVLCLSAAGVLRLNPAALQFLNNVASPLQLTLLAPFARAGAWLCGNAPGGNLGMAAAYAVVGWACISIPCGLALYLLLIWLVRRRRQVLFQGAESAA